MWTLWKGETPYGYLGPLLERGAYGGFGEIGLCKSRLGEIIPVKSLARSFVSLSIKGKTSGRVFTKGSERKENRTWTQPALDTCTHSKTLFFSFLEDRDPERAVAGWDWASTSCRGGVLWPGLYLSTTVSRYPQCTIPAKTVRRPRSRPA